MLRSIFPCFARSVVFFFFFFNFFLLTEKKTKQNKKQKQKKTLEKQYRRVFTSPYVIRKDRL